MFLMRLLSGGAVLIPSARLLFTIVRKPELIICKHLRCGQTRFASGVRVSHPSLEGSEGWGKSKVSHPPKIEKGLALPAELTADGEQKERKEGGSQQSFDDSQDAAPRINRRVLRISLKCGRIDGRDSALADQFCFRPAIVRPGVLLVPDAPVRRDC